MAQIRVDWFKESGKWYAGGLVEVYSFQIWQPQFKQAIVNNQTELADSWNDHDDWFVVTTTTQEQDDDPDFHMFYTHLFKPGAFNGLKKESK